MGKILLFETTVMYFLRETIIYLREILQNPGKREEILDELYEMISDIHEVLPDYCYGVISNIQTITLTKMNWNEKEKIIQETISICKILMKKPSVNTFKQLIEKNYSALSLDTRFSENFIYLLMQKLIANQKFYERSLKITKNKREHDYYQERLNENDIWWIAICRMPNITETLLLKALRYAKLEHCNFYQFCIEIAVSQNTTENVMLALIDRIQKENFDTLSNGVSRNMKTSLVISIFKLNTPSINVIRKAVQSIRPGERFYYDFYHYMIFHSCHDIELLREIQKKVREKRNLSKKNLVPSLNRLTFLLDNVLLEKFEA